MLTMKRICRKYARLLGLLFVAASTCTFADEGGGVSPAALYQRNCSVCHGEKGDGNSRARKSLAKEPSDFTAEDARRKLPRDYMIAIVRDGKHEAAMVGRKSRLSQAQIEVIVDFIRTAFMPPEPGSMLARGREIYLKTCAGCHGVRGQGATERTALPLSLSPAGTPRTREQLIAAMSREEHAKQQGGVVAGFAAQLSSADIDTVANYILSAFIDAVYFGKPLSPPPGEAN